MERFNKLKSNVVVKVLRRVVKFSPKRLIWERKPETLLGRGLHRTAKNTYRAVTFPQKATVVTGLVSLKIAKEAAKTSARMSAYHIDNKVRNATHAQNHGMSRVAVYTTKLPFKGVAFVARCIYLKRKRKRIVQKLERIPRVEGVRGWILHKRLKFTTWRALRVTYYSHGATVISRGTKKVTNVTVRKTVKQARRITARIVHRQTRPVAVAKYGKLSGKVSGAVVGGATFVTIVGLKKVGATTIFKGGEIASDRLREIAADSDSVAAANVTVIATSKLIKQTTGVGMSSRERLVRIERKVSKLERKTNSLDSKIVKGKEKFQKKKGMTKEEWKKLSKPELKAKKAQIKTANKARRRAKLKNFKVGVKKVFKTLKSPKAMAKLLLLGIKKFLILVVLPLLPIMLAVLGGIMIIAVILAPVVTVLFSTYLAEDSDIYAAHGHFRQLVASRVHNTIERVYPHTPNIEHVTITVNGNVFDGNFLTDTLVDPFIQVSYLSAYYFVFDEPTEEVVDGDETFHGGVFKYPAVLAVWRNRRIEDLNRGLAALVEISAEVTETESECEVFSPVGEWNPDDRNDVGFIQTDDILFFPPTDEFDEWRAVVVAAEADSVHIGGGVYRIVGEYVMNVLEIDEAVIVDDTEFTLTPLNLYHMEFYRIRGLRTELTINVKFTVDDVIKHIENVYSTENGYTEEESEWMLTMFMLYMETQGNRPELFP
jgi:hypothetical protein